MLENLDPPEHLDPAAAAVWRQLATPLRQAMLLTEADVIAFELLCNAVADVRAARSERRGRFTDTTPKGGVMLDQLLVAEQMLVKRVESLGSRFGLDPAARTRITVNPQADLFGNQPTGTGRFFSS